MNNRRSPGTAERQPPHYEAPRWQEHSNPRASWRRARARIADGNNEQFRSEQEGIHRAARAVALNQQLSFG